MLVYTARCLLPVSGPPVRDAAVAVARGRIVACGARAAVLARAPGAERRELGRVALIPGLVNAHTHLELSWMGDDPPAGGDWVRWVRGLLERREAEDPERAAAAAERALARATARGTVAFGDVGNRGESAGLLAASGAAAVVFLEVYGFRADRAGELLGAATERLERVRAGLGRAAGGVRVVLAPHAPHTTSPALLAALGARAAAAGEPLSIHLAESAAECAFVRDGGGPFAELLRERGMAEASWSGCGCGPVEHVARLGLLGRRTLAVHCVHLEADDVGRLAAAGATVVTCPRSNRALGVGTAPLAALDAAGVRVALGTDSLASAPDLDLFAEMAALAAEHPAIAPGAVLRMATQNGAAALGLGDRLGSIEPGKLARIVAVPLGPGEDDPERAVCSHPPRVHLLERAPWEPAA